MATTGTKRRTIKKVKEGAAPTTGLPPCITSEIDSLEDVSNKIMEKRVMRLNQGDARRIRAVARRVGELIEYVRTGRVGDE